MSEIALLVLKKGIFIAGISYHGCMFDLYGITRVTFHS